MAVEADAYCLNFLCYSGAEKDSVDLLEGRDVPLKDVDEIARLCLAGWVGTAIRRPENETGRWMALRRWRPADRKEI